MLPWNWNIIFSFEWEHPQCLSTEIKEEEKKIRLNDPTNKIFPFFTSGVSTASSSALGSPWTSGATSVSGAGVSGAAASSGGAASSTQSRVKKESYRWIKTEHTASRALTTGEKKLSWNHGASINITQLKEARAAILFFLKEGRRHSNIKSIQWDNTTSLNIFCYKQKYYMSNPKQ